MTRVLVAEGMVDEVALVKALGQHIGVDFVSLAETTIDPAAAALIPESLARRYGVIPIRFRASHWSLPWSIRATCWSSTTSAPSPVAVL